MTTTPASKLAEPHPFPYQGSKRSICEHILSRIPAGTGLLVEPFCGSAAVSLAAAARRRAKRFWLNDANAPLIALRHTIGDLNRRAARRRSTTSEPRNVGVGSGSSRGMPAE